jgi:hypothetical protein
LFSTTVLALADTPVSVVPIHQFPLEPINGVNPFSPCALTPVETPLIHQ